MWTPEAEENVDNQKTNRNESASPITARKPIILSVKSKPNEDTEMSTPNNNEESPPETAAEEAAIEKKNDPTAVSTQSENTANTITNTNKLVFTGGVNGGEEEDGDEGRQNPVDCLFEGPNICPIDPNLVDRATKSI